MRNRAELIEIAKQIRAGHLFGTWNLPEHDVRLVPLIFMPLSLMNDEEMKTLKSRDVAHLFEHFDKAMPRGVNGYPCFPSFKTLDAEETRQVSEIIKTLEAAETEAVQKMGQ